jgi:predicted dehydrogenase
MTGERPLRFGLVGTGHWARVSHAPALASTDGIEFAAVWGRNREATADLAASYGVTPHHDIAAFLDGLDGVAFAVPPDVQAPIATTAANAGKHLLLEKPIATTGADADRLVAAVDQAGVASVVFFTARFQAEVRAWLAAVAAGSDPAGGAPAGGTSASSAPAGGTPAGGASAGCAPAGGAWAGGYAVWLGTAWQDSSPFNTPWRRDKGGLWDLGPHVVSLLWASLGPVTSVVADAGPADVSHLVLHHESGASSTATLTLSAPEAAEHFELYVWGEPGRSAAPREPGRPLAPLRTALTELASNARSGRVSHPCDVRFGRAVGRVLAEAQRQIDTRRRVQQS